MGNQEHKIGGIYYSTPYTGRGRHKVRGRNRGVQVMHDGVRVRLGSSLRFTDPRAGFAGVSQRPTASVNVILSLYHQNQGSAEGQDQIQGHCLDTPWFRLTGQCALGCCAGSGFSPGCGDCRTHFQIRFEARPVTPRVPISLTTQSSHGILPHFISLVEPDALW